MPTANLTASAPSIESGQSSTLTWTTSNAASVTLNGSTVALNGSQTVSPSVTTTYTLRATNTAGTSVSTAVVTVTAPPPPPVPMPTAHLAASAASIEVGQSAMLTWTTSNAASVMLDGSPVASNGSQTVSPGVTTTYTLTATNATGTAVSTAVVMVTAPPPPPPAPAFTFTADIQPVFQSQCIGCHNTNFKTAGVDLSSYQTVQPLVASHDASARLVVATQPGGVMHNYVGPFGTMTAADVIDMIKQWVLSGAPQ
jgi:hypothetical protein